MKPTGTRTSTWIVLIVTMVAVAPALAGTPHTAKQTPPVKMGTSGGSVNDHSSLYCCSGTLGSLVTRDGVLSILSNNHVLARSGLATAGEDTMQPGFVDTGCAVTGNIVGDFAGDLVPLGKNVDAAISTARSNVDATGSILEVGVPCSSVQAPAIGLNVMKSGRTTGLTTGSIQAINASVTVQYQKGCGTGKRFYETYTNQITIGPSSFSGSGDSGSLILSNDGSPNPVGLLFAGSSSTTIANPASAVVSAFQSGGHTFSFVGNACAVNEGPRPVGPSDADVAFVTKVKEAHEADLFTEPNVIGVGVGASEADPTVAAIVVYVEATNASLPRGLPAEIDGIPVRVIPTDPFVAY